MVTTKIVLRMKIILVNGMITDYDQYIGNPHKSNEAMGRGDFWDQSQLFMQLFDGRHDT
jgi:hypothetical protein